MDKDEIKGIVLWVIGLVAFIGLLVWLLTSRPGVQTNNDVIISQYKKCQDAGMDAWQGESMNVYCIPKGQNPPKN